MMQRPSHVNCCHPVRRVELTPMPIISATAYGSELNVDDEVSERSWITTAPTSLFEVRTWQVYPPVSFS